MIHFFFDDLNTPSTQGFFLLTASLETAGFASCFEIDIKPKGVPEEIANERYLKILYLLRSSLVILEVADLLDTDTVIAIICKTIQKITNNFIIEIYFANCNQCFMLQVLYD